METNSSEKVMIEIGKGDLIELSDYAHFLEKGLVFRGTNADGGQEFYLTLPKYADFCERQQAVTKIVDNMLNNYKNVPAEPEKPKPSYCEKVFDLISSRSIPGVGSIEVNESQRKFVVKYKYDEPLEAYNEPIWTLSKLRREIAALEAYNSSGGAFGRPLSLLEFLMSEHTIIWADDGKPYSVEVAMDENGNPKMKE